MQSRYIRFLVPVILVFTLGAVIAWPTFEGFFFRIGDNTIDWPITVHTGLDLQGGLQVLLEADLPEGETITDESMSVATTIIENRVNGLGVTEPIVQRQGDRRISVELPGLTDTEQALALIKQTGLLEFVDVGSAPLAPGTPVVTTGELGVASVDEVTDFDGTVYQTVMTGSDLREANVGQDQAGGYAIYFTLNDEGAVIFSDHTGANRGQYLAIVLDGEVISSPRINDQIPNGEGTISGAFTLEEANNLALSLRYGSLPVPLEVVESRTVGPTLGQDSVDASLVAGIIGVIMVGIFMVLYYRLPGLIALLALSGYVAVTFALFKLIPVTLTLPGIAGFILSMGVAVDANILIFERMKEELRAGRTLNLAIEEGFRRAWPSIRDSNISTIITCGILYWFGGQFGATIVKGFALTLFVGVVVSLFTAITATRSFLVVALTQFDIKNYKTWFGV